MAAISKTPAVLSSEILIKNAGHQGYFILLEGDFDQRFWGNRLTQNLRLINCTGKPHVLGTLELLTRQNKAENIVALVDKDYDEILSRLASHQNLVYTDKNDLEVTLLNCPSDTFVTVVNRILDEYVDKTKRDNFEKRIGHSVIEHIRKVAADYGVLRLINEKLQLCISFDKEIKIQNDKFLDKKDIILHKNVLHDYFIEAAARSVDLLTEIQLHRESGLFSGWQLVQGHDLMQLLAIAINSESLKPAKEHKQASEDSLGRDLRSMLHKHDLQTTTMFQTLEQHGQRVGLVFFK